MLPFTDVFAMLHLWIVCYSRAWLGRSGDVRQRALAWVCGDWASDVAGEAAGQPLRTATTSGVVGDEISGAARGQSGAKGQ